jgi:SET domain-containing protein
MQDFDGAEKPRSQRRDRSPRVVRTHLGWGVFAGRPYSAEEIIGEIDGTVIDDWDYGSSYCMDMGDSRCLEPAAPFRFVNHSCQPNCQFQWYDIDQEDAPPRRRVFLLALARIAAGEELTIDYAWPAHMAIPCRCHSANCRGWVVARSELPGLVESLNPGR